MDENAETPERLRMRVSIGQYANLYVSSTSGVPLGVYGGAKYFLHEEQGAAYAFSQSDPALPARRAKLKKLKSPIEVESVK